MTPILQIKNLSVQFGNHRILQDVSLSIQENEIFGIVGPSGAGKSTLLRAINRMLDFEPGCRIRGTIRFRDHDIYAPGVDADALREEIGILFQQPVIFPTSIAANVLFGARRLRKLSKAGQSDLIEQSLLSVGLWDEVKDRLRHAALNLSVGQQQRLCLARTLALDPSVLLMDEPTSSLDARSTEAIEQLILQLKAERTIVLITHNLAQARRVTDWVACLCVNPQTGEGELLESACCDAFFTSDACQRVFDQLPDDTAAPPRPPASLNPSTPS